MPLKEINTKKGDRMAFVSLEDLGGMVEVIVFSELYKNSSLLLKSEDPVFIKGRVDAGRRECEDYRQRSPPLRAGGGQVDDQYPLALAFRWAEAGRPGGDQGDFSGLPGEFSRLSPFNPSRRKGGGHRPGGRMEAKFQPTSWSAACGTSSGMKR